MLANPSLQTVTNRLCTVALACFGFVVTLNADQVTGESSKTSWPGFLGANRNGISLETGIRTDWSEGQLPVLWQIESADGYCIGSVADNRYYHFDSSNNKARLRSVDANTGNEIWRYEYVSNYRDMYGYDSGPRASPLIDGDQVYIYGVEGILHCLDIKNGNLIWSCDTAKRFGVVQNFFGVGSSPIVHEELLIAMVGGSPSESQLVPPGALAQVESNRSGVVAFDKRTGNVVYQTIDDLASYSSIRLGKLENKTFAYAWMRDRLHWFDPKTGDQLFEFPWRSRKLESVNAMTPVIDHRGNIFISDCYEKGGLLIRPKINGTVEVVWSDDTKRNQSLKTHWNTPILIDGFMYGCSGRHSSEAELRCVNFETGKVMWSQTGLSRTTVTAIDGHLIVLGERGDLRLVKADPNEFKEVTKWEPENLGQRLSYPAWAAPIVSDGKMFVRDKNKLVCFGLMGSRANRN